MKRKKDKQIVCKFCGRKITIFHRLVYASKILYYNFLFDLGMFGLREGRVTNSYYYWDDVKDLSKGKIYFHHKCMGKCMGDFEK